MLMGVVTAAFGGVLRDIVVNEIPRAFKDRQPYAVCAFVGGWVVATQAMGLPDGWTLLAGALAATGLRALALASGMTLPRLSTGVEAPA